MHIRRFAAADLSRLLDITIETFRPYHEGYLRTLLGDVLFQHQHGHWEQDYRDELPTLHDPGAGRRISVAEIDDRIVGFVAWNVNTDRRQGEIYLLAVDATARGQHVGSKLCTYAIEQMNAEGIFAVQIGTGGDPFHAPARALYESLGFIKIPTSAYLRVTGDSARNTR
jgi:ribosomal protein S18 acetylase RimI-like enzyme